MAAPLTLIAASLTALETRALELELGIGGSLVTAPKGYAVPPKDAGNGFEVGPAIQGRASLTSGAASLGLRGLAVLGPRGEDFVGAPGAPDSWGYRAYALLAEAGLRTGGDGLTVQGRAGVGIGSIRLQCTCSENGVRSSDVAPLFSLSGAVRVPLRPASWISFELGAQLWTGLRQDASFEGPSGWFDTGMRELAVTLTASYGFSL